MIQNKNLLLIIYFAYTPQAKNINWYRSVYSGFNIIFYAEDDNKTNKNEYDNDIIWINLGIGSELKNNDWFMHRCLLDCIPKHKHDGYIFMTDDVLFRYWLFNDFSIDKFWLTRNKWPKTNINTIIENLQKKNGYHKLWDIGNPACFCLFLKNSSQKYRDNMKAHFGDESTCIQLANNDFIYIPEKFAEEWYKNSSEMDKCGMNFVSCFGQAAYGSCGPKDIITITGDYSRKNAYNENDHINHPIKLSSKENRDKFENEIRRSVKNRIKIFDISNYPLPWPLINQGKINNNSN